MRIQILLVLICGILSAKGSPLDIDEKSKAAEAVQAAETLKENKSTKTAELGKGTETDKKGDLSEALKDEVASAEGLKEAEASKPDQLTNAAGSNKKPESEKASENKLVESADNLLVKTDSAETSDVPEGRPVGHASIIIHTTSIFQSQPLIPDSIRKIGPVELGLRNVVAASAAATEGLHMEMSALSSETSHMISSKAEILTAQTMNNLFEPLNKVEDLIRETDECGKPYEPSLNAIFKEIDSSMKSCSENLLAIDTRYKSENAGVLTSLSFTADEMNNLPESCEIAQNFAVGTFCIVNNLAEMNGRVLSDINVLKENTAQTEEKAMKELAAIDVCQQKMAETVAVKLAKLLKEVHQKCVERKNDKSK